MEGRYPKFLRKNPSFMGLEPIDLLMVGVGLFLSLILRLPSLLGMMVTISLIGASKLVRKNLDLTGLLLLVRKKKRVEWMDELRRIGG